MKLIWLCLFALVIGASAQVAIPAGTVIPAVLDSKLDARKSKPGQAIKASVAQDVLLPTGEKIKSGTHLSGKILAVTPASVAQPASISFRFDSVETKGSATAVVTDLRAMASPLEVDDALTAKNVPERGLPPWDQTLDLIGGDVSYRGDGTVRRSGFVIGKSVYSGAWGVLSRLSASGGCRGEVAGNDRAQPLWIFSHDACGLYGFDAKVLHAGRTEPEGEIVIGSTKQNLLIRSGSAMLLRVDGAE